MQDAIEGLKKIIAHKPDLSKPRIADLGISGDAYVIAVLIDPKEIAHMNDDSKAYIFGRLAGAAELGLRDAGDTHLWTTMPKLEYSARVAGAFASECDGDDDSSYFQSANTIQKRLDAVSAPESVQKAFRDGIIFGKNNNMSDEDRDGYFPHEHGEIFAEWLKQQEILAKRS